MSTHENIRLETPGGEVVAYLAPNVESTPAVENDVSVNGVPGPDPPFVVDLQRWTAEIQLQGFFEHSDALPRSHADALRNLFGTDDVTAEEQLWRVWEYGFRVGGPFELYWRGTEFTAVDEDDVDIENGVLPAVWIRQFRPPTEGGLGRASYLLQLAVGVEG